LFLKNQRANDLQITEHVIKKIKAYDQKVLLDLYQFTFSNLMRVAVRYKTNRSDQMTLVNNAFMKIISKIDSFKTGTNYEAWSRKIIQNEIIDDFRKSNRNSHVLYTNNYLNEGESYDNYDLDEKYEEQKILHLLQELPPATRMVFSLFALDDMKSKEISNLLNISSETVKWHLSEARKKLKSELTKINLSENERG
jgi:RNA polymerase sigma-70 factor (ECF subfamily)